MAKKKGGKNSINTKVARQGYNKAQGHVDTLINLTNHLYDLLSTTNESVWSGGKPANKWYNNAAERYANLVKFTNGLVGFQNQLQAQFKKAKSADIDF